VPNGPRPLGMSGAIVVLCCTMSSIKIVFFGTSTIQKARRIALDANLLTTLKLQEGDIVRIDLDVDSSTILIRKEAVPEKLKISRGRSRA